MSNTRSYALNGWEQAVLPGSRTRTVEVAEDAPYRLWLSLPEAPPPPSGYPLVVVLDGADLFVTVQDSVRRLARRPEVTGVSPTVVLGIDTALPSRDRDRWRRFAMTWSDPQDDRELPPGEAAGGGSAYLETVCELARTLGTEIALDPRRRSLLGHSLAGYFVLHALTVKPACFRTFGAVSPSIWWNPDALRNAITEAGRTDASVLLTVGEREEGPTARPKAAARRMIGHASECASLLTALLGEDAVGFHILPDENHASVVNAALSRYLCLASSS